MSQFRWPLAVGSVAWVAAVVPASASWAQGMAPDDTLFPVASEATPALPGEMTAPDAAIALDFSPPVSVAQDPVPLPGAIAASESPASVPGPSAEPVPVGDRRTERLYAGGSDSLVARTVGAAEGTRTPNGGKTALYEGHVDPGNGVWNRGTFSYQFGNSENLSPDEADRRQLAKIQRIHETVLLAKAAQYNLAPLSLAEEINGIDLINQAPLAVTEAGGYIERLAEAKQKKGLSGDGAILEARVWAFWDGDRGGWDAPGLRAYDDISKEASIRHDQDRRMGMINQALAAYEREKGAIAQALTAPPVTPADAIAQAIIYGSTP